MRGRDAVWLKAEVLLLLRSTQTMTHPVFMADKGKIPAIPWRLLSPSLPRSPKNLISIQVAKSAGNLAHLGPLGRSPLRRVTSLR